MQINTVNPIVNTRSNNDSKGVSFTSRRSITRMLRLPRTTQVAKDINELTGFLVKKAYKNKEIIPPVTVTQKNATALEKAKKLMKSRLIVDDKLKSAIKDETLEVPFTDVVKLFDILSKN